MTHHVEIANEIRKQLEVLGGMAIWAWGANNWGAIDGKDKNHGGLVFKVNGLKHKGYIQIDLDFNDTYSVELFKIRKHERKTVAQFSEIYFDQLVPLLDPLVEG